MNKVMKLLLILGFSLAAFFFQMNVAMKLWQWIAVPLRAAPLDLAHAFGLSLIAGLFQAMPGDNKAKGIELATAKVIFTFINSAVALGLGYWIFG